MKICYIHTFYSRNQMETKNNITAFIFLLRNILKNEYIFLYYIRKTVCVCMFAMHSHIYAWIFILFFFLI
jgi:hypothetical protein